MTNALITAVQSMHNDLRYMETVSQNMVNISTPGYKRAIPVAPAFDAALQAARQTGDAAPVVPALSTLLDLAPGAVKQTGRGFDLAIGGDGYFEVAGPDSLSYTRAGDFRLDARGRLVTQGGDPVQGLQGEILVSGNAVSIERDGRVLQDGAPVGQLKIVRFANPKALAKNGAGQMQAGPGAAATLDAHPTLQVGYLENSNVAPMREMMAMMETTRHFEAAQKLFQGYDEVLGSAITKLGQF